MPFLRTTEQRDTWPAEQSRADGQTGMGAIHGRHPVAERCVNAAAKLHPTSAPDVLPIRERIHIVPGAYVPTGEKNCCTTLTDATRTTFFDDIFVHVSYLVRISVIFILLYVAIALVLVWYVMLGLDETTRPLRNAWYYSYCCYACITHHGHVPYSVRAYGCVTLWLTIQE